MQRRCRHGESGIGGVKVTIISLGSLRQAVTGVEVLVRLRAVTKGEKITQKEGEKVCLDMLVFQHDLNEGLHNVFRLFEEEEKRQQLGGH